MSVLIIAILMGTIPTVKNDGTEALLRDACGGRYPLFFQTTFGTGKEVDHRLHAPDYREDKEFQKQYAAEPLFEIDQIEGTCYLRNLGDPGVVLHVIRGNSSFQVGEEPEPLYPGTEIIVCLDEIYEFHFWFEWNAS